MRGAECHPTGAVAAVQGPGAAAKSLNMLGFYNEARRRPKAPDLVPSAVAEDVALPGAGDISSVFLHISRRSFLLRISRLGRVLRFLGDPRSGERCHAREFPLEGQPLSQENARRPAPGPGARCSDTQFPTSRRPGRSRTAIGIIAQLYGISNRYRNVFKCARKPSLMRW